MEFVTFVGYLQCSEIMYVSLSYELFVELCYDRPSYK